MQTFSTWPPLPPPAELQMQAALRESAGEQQLHKPLVSPPQLSQAETTHERHPGSSPAVALGTGDSFAAPVVTFPSVMPLCSPSVPAAAQGESALLPGDGKVMRHGDG